MRVKIYLILVCFFVLATICAQKPQQKSEKLVIGVFPDKQWSKLKKSEQFDWNTAFTFLNNMSDMTVYNFKKAHIYQEKLIFLMRSQASMMNSTEIKQVLNYKNMMEKTQVLVRLQISTISKNFDGVVYWFAKIQIEAINTRPHDKLFSIQGKTEGTEAFKKAKPVPQTKSLSLNEVRASTVKNVTQIAAKIFVKKIKAIKFLKRGFYELAFVGFSKEQLKTIDSIIKKLAKGKKPYCKKLSGDFTNNSKNIEIQWLRKDSLYRIIAIIKEACSEKEIFIQVMKAKTGYITFQLEEEEEED